MRKRSPSKYATLARGRLRRPLTRIESPDELKKNFPCRNHPSIGATSGSPFGAGAATAMVFIPSISFTTCFAFSEYLPGWMIPFMCGPVRFRLRSINAWRVASSLAVSRTGEIVARRPKQCRRVRRERQVVSLSPRADVLSLPEIAHQRGVRPRATEQVPGHLGARRVLAAVEEHDRARAAVQLACPDLDGPLPIHAAALTAEAILIDGDDLGRGEDRTRRIAHRAYIVPRDQRRREDRPQ